MLIQKRKKILLTEAYQSIWRNIKSKASNLFLMFALNLPIDWLNPLEEDVFWPMEWVLVSNIRNHIYHRIGSNTFPSACFYTLFCYCFKLIGKTLQIVCLTQALITNNINSLVETVLILSPVSTIQNWANEFKKWLAFCEKPNKIRVRTLLRWVFFLFECGFFFSSRSPNSATWGLFINFR